MPLLLFNVSFDRPNPRVISADTPAVPAEPYSAVDDAAGNPGGITRADIQDQDIRPVGCFQDGDEVLVESDDPDAVLDDTDTETAALTRIWWRATVIERWPS